MPCRPGRAQHGTSVSGWGAGWPIPKQSQSETSKPGGRKLCQAALLAHHHLHSLRPTHALAHSQRRANASKQIITTGGTPHWLRTSCNLPQHPKPFQRMCQLFQLPRWLVAVGSQGLALGARPPAHREKNSDHDLIAIVLRKHCPDNQNFQGRGHSCAHTNSGLSIDLNAHPAQHATLSCRSGVLLESAREKGGSTVVPHDAEAYDCHFPATRKLCPALLS